MDGIRKRELTARFRKALPDLTKLKLVLAECLPHQCVLCELSHPHRGRVYRAHHGRTNPSACGACPASDDGIYR